MQHRHKRRRRRSVYAIPRARSIKEADPYRIPFEAPKPADMAQLAHVLSHMRREIDFIKRTLLRVTGVTLTAHTNKKVRRA